MPGLRAMEVIDNRRYAAGLVKQLQQRFYGAYALSTEYFTARSQFCQAEQALRPTDSLLVCGSEQLYEEDDVGH